MTYSLQAVASWQDVVDEIETFAAARGWTTTGGSGAAATIENPSTTLVTTLTASTDYLTLSPASGVDSRCRKPWLNGTYPGTPSKVNPVQVHLFGNNSPYSAPDTEPFIAAVVGFGFNNYRHIYIGTLVAAGNYTDGDVVTCNDFSQTYTDLYPVNARSRYLFNAYNAHSDGATYAGGAKITHADNSTTWRAFLAAGVSTSFLTKNWNSLDGTEVFGGNADGFNDGMVHRAHADFAAGQLLVPVNLYCSDGDDGTNYRIRPLGHVSGARLIDMDGMDPEEQFSISADDWRAFPEFSKRSDAFMDWSEIGTTTYWPYEFSGMFGLAYRENS